MSQSVTTVPREGRALWVSRFDFRTADDIRRVVAQAADAHFNQIWMQVRGAADAFYQSALEPWDERLTGTLGGVPNWDPLGLMVSEAHRAGLEVQAWINVYPAWQGTTPPPNGVTPTPLMEEFTRLYGDQWRQWDQQNGPMPLSEGYVYASPGHWAVSERIAAVVRDLLSKYYIDGVHLDHVRYASSNYSWDPVSLARLAAAQVLEPALNRVAWQRRQISELVARLHELIRVVKPGLVLSAAVWPVYKDIWEWWPNNDGYSAYCQDSVGWLHAGICDVIAPMLYGSILNPNQDYFRLVVEEYARLAPGLQVYAGISAETIDAAEIGQRIDIVRTAGLPGQALFSARLLDRVNAWEVLRQGPYAEPALIPRAQSAVPPEFRAAGL